MPFHFLEGLVNKYHSRYYTLAFSMFQAWKSYQNHLIFSLHINLVS